MLIDVLTTVSTPVAPSTALSPGPDWWGALNGLHPLVIHFPIALVITAAVVEFIAMLARQERPTQFTVISLVVAAFASALAAWSGWGLADEGYGGGESSRGGGGGAGGGAVDSAQRGRCRLARGGGVLAFERPHGIRIAPS